MADGYVEGWDELQARVSTLEDLVGSLQAENANLVGYINAILVPFTASVEFELAGLREHTHNFVTETPDPEESPSPIFGDVYGIGPYGSGPYGTES